jgi:hypothetical protein
VTLKKLKDNSPSISTFIQSNGRMIDLAIIVNLRMKGQCFNYKEKWSKGHKDKTPRKIHMIKILKGNQLEVDEMR